MSNKTIQYIGATIIAPTDNKDNVALDRCSPYPPSDDEREDGRRSATNDYRYKTSEELTDEERAELCTQIRDLIDYYFGDENYPHDKYLRRQSRKTEDGTISLDLLVRYKKLKKLTKDINLVADAVRDSNFVELSADRLSLKRSTPLPTLEDTADKLQRTIALEGEEHLGNLAKDEATEFCGQVVNMRIISPDDPIPRDLKQTYLLENGTLSGLTQMKREHALILLELKNREVAQAAMQHFRGNSNLVFSIVASLYVMTQPQSQPQPNKKNKNLLDANGGTRRARSASRSKNDRWKSRSPDPRSRSADPRSGNGMGRSTSPRPTLFTSQARPRSTSPSCQPSSFRTCGARSVSPRICDDNKLRAPSPLCVPSPLRTPSPLLRMPIGPENASTKGFGARRTGGWKPIQADNA